MPANLEAVRNHFLDGMSQLSHFLGFPETMGRIYGAIYLAPDPLTPAALAAEVDLPLEQVEATLTILERLEIVQSTTTEAAPTIAGFVAEMDFWKVIRHMMDGREDNEFGVAVQAVAESRAMLRQDEAAGAADELAAFYDVRLANMHNFFKTLERLVATMIALDNLRGGSMSRLFSGTTSDA